jgi:hypothetical protein
MDRIILILIHGSIKRRFYHAAFVDRNHWPLYRGLSIVREVVSKGFKGISLTFYMERSEVGYTVG